MAAMSSDELYAMAGELRMEMQEAAESMEYEKAAWLRDEITRIEAAVDTDRSA